jgi:hypothetical protein
MLTFETASRKLEISIYYLTWFKYPPDGWILNLLQKKRKWVTNQVKFWTYNSLNRSWGKESLQLLRTDISQLSFVAFSLFHFWYKLSTHRRLSKKMQNEWRIDIKPEDKNSTQPAKNGYIFRTINKLFYAASQYFESNDQSEFNQSDFLLQKEIWWRNSHIKDKD